MISRINIQSISDIITNSSSEVFCRIGSKTMLNEIFELFKELFPGTDCDYEVVARLINFDENEKEWLPEEVVKQLEECRELIEIEMPYSMSECETFYKFGISGILNEKFPNGDYVVVFGNEY